MNWFWIALVPPVMHSVANHLDKLLISKYVKDGAVGTLVIFTALFAFLALPVIFLLEPSVVGSVTFWQATILIGNGAVLVAGIIMYLYALRDDEASYAIPLFQLIPVFGLGLGYVFLGELVNSTQGLAICILVAGAIMISLDLDRPGLNFRWRTMAYMLGASLSYAITSVIFKSVAVETTFLGSLFWDMAGKGLSGLLLLLLVRSYRIDFIQMLTAGNRLALISLNSLNELIALIGEIAYVLAAMLVPVAVAQSVSSVQPAIVFILGLLMTRFAPQLGRESMASRNLAQKFAATVILLVGAIMLERSS